MSHNATISTLGFLAKNPIKKRPREPGPIIARRHFSFEVFVTSEKAESQGLAARRVPAPAMPKFFRKSRLLIGVCFMLVVFKIIIGLFENQLLNTGAFCVS